MLSDSSGFQMHASSGDCVENEWSVLWRVVSAIISCGTLFGEGKHCNGREVTVVLSDYDKLGCNEDIITRLFERKNARRRVELESYGVVMPNPKQKLKKLQVYYSNPHPDLQSLFIQYIRETQFAAAPVTPVLLPAIPLEAEAAPIPPPPPPPQVNPVLVNLNGKKRITITSKNNNTTSTNTSNINTSTGTDNTNMHTSTNNSTNKPSSTTNNADPTTTSAHAHIHVPTLTNVLAGPVHIPPLHTHRLRTEAHAISPFYCTTNNNEEQALIEAEQLERENALKQDRAAAIDKASVGATVLTIAVLIRKFVFKL